MRSPKTPRTRSSTQRATPAAVDQLRARALRDDALRDLTDARREWVWRSLLKGVRTAEALTLAGMTADDLTPALERVRQRYQRRLDQYKQAVQHEVRVRRLVEKAKPADTSTRQRRGWWPFGRQSRS